MLCGIEMYKKRGCKKGGYYLCNPIGMVGGVSI